MPTLRSEYSLEQFEEVLQKFAHKIALDAVKNLDQGDVLIRISGPRLSRVETSKVSIRFYANHVGYYEEPTRNYNDWWGFDAERKIYLTSNHSSKISFAREENRKKVTEFIDKLMAEASIKPIPRFKLSNYSKR